jgi:hypothetical protein
MRFVLRKDEDEDAHFPPPRAALSLRSYLKVRKRGKAAVRYGHFDATAVICMSCVDDCIELVIEQKPDRFSTILDMQEARDQTLSHLSKALPMLLNYCGAGIPTRHWCDRNLCLYKVVRRLELIDPGTSRARVSLVQSEPFTLRQRTLKSGSGRTTASWENRTAKAAIEEVKAGAPDPDGKGGLTQQVSGH